MRNLILVIDDDEAFHFYMKSLFKKHSHIKVLKAYDGQEALDIISSLRHPPSLIFLDLNMPMMDGHEFLKRWMQHNDTSQTRVVIVSSSEAQKDKEKTRSYECVKDYVVKPALADKIDDHINAST